MHKHELAGNSPLRQWHHFLFYGLGSRIYDMTMVRFTGRLYRRVVKDVAQVLTKGKVLDVGTGPGTLVRLIAHSQPGLEVHGIDLSEDMIRLAGEHSLREQLQDRVHFKVANVGELPYPDQSFDLIVSTISMHHWNEIEQPLRELYRVLRPGGRLWIYDFRFFKIQTVEKARAKTPFNQISLEHSLVRTGLLPFTFYQRFALQKPASNDPA
jgi:ubiquinone/menaquinone biosynthesis C-methylase UbiE